MFSKKIKISLTALVLTLFLGGCSFSFPWEKDRSGVETEAETTTLKGVVEIKELTSSGDLRRFASLEALDNFLSSNKNSKNISTAWLSTDEGYGQGEEALAAVVSSGFSGSDIVKVSNNYAYAIVRNSVQIISLKITNRTQVVGKIELTSRPQEILVSGNRLVVFGVDEEIKRSDLYNNFSRQNNYTYFKIFDISNPTSPRELRSLSFEGDYVSARLLNGRIFFLTAQPVDYQNKENILPYIVDNDELLLSDCVEEKDCLSDIVYYFDNPYNGYVFLSATGINLTAEEADLSRQIFLIDPSYNLHISSQGNLYLGRYQSLSKDDLEQEIKLEQVFSHLSPEEQLVIKETKEAPDYTISLENKNKKIADIVDRYLILLEDDKREALEGEIPNKINSKIKSRLSDLEKTTIYKFTFKSNQINYRAKGEVIGKIFSPSAWYEYENSLHLATTRNDLWSSLFEDELKYYSNIYTLDNNLKLVGSLENIASDSTLKSAKFFGNRAYLMPADDKSPIYVAGVKTASDPVIMGAVKLSSDVNLQAIDKEGENILALSRELEEDEDSSGGLKLAIFDFSDLKKPKEVSSYLVGDRDSDSIALSDHKALAYDEENGLVSLPVSLIENGKLAFAGALIFSVEEKKLNLVGRIDHSDGGSFDESDKWRGFDYKDNSVKRSAFWDDLILTFSNKFLFLHRWPSLEEVIKAMLTPNPLGYIISPEPVITPEPELPAPPLEEVVEIVPEESPSVDAPITPLANEETEPISNPAPTNETSLEEGDMVTEAEVEQPEVETNPEPVPDEVPVEVPVIDPFMDLPPTDSGS